MQTERLTVTDKAWTTINVSASSVSFQGQGSVTALLCAVGATEPGSNAEALKIAGNDCVRGVYLSGLSASDNVYIKSQTGDIFLVVVH